MNTLHHQCDSCSNNAAVLQNYNQILLTSHANSEQTISQCSTSSTCKSDHILEIFIYFYLSQKGHSMDRIRINKPIYKAWLYYLILVMIRVHV